MGKFGYKSNTQVNTWNYKPTNTLNNNQKSPYNSTHNNNRQYNNNNNGYNQQRNDYHPYKQQQSPQQRNNNIQSHQHNTHTPHSIAAASRTTQSQPNTPVLKQQSPQQKQQNLATLHALQHNLPPDIKKILTESNELLPYTIKFVRAVRPESIKPHNSSLPPPINPQYTTNNTSTSQPTTPAKELSSSVIVDENAFAEPAYYLFEPTQLQPYMKWKHSNRIGVGLHNLGNTCFLNATLQALAYIPVLQQYCATQEHSQHCTYKQAQQICFFCLVESQLIKLHTSHSSIAPQQIAQSMRILSRRFQIGRQEDAHELLRCLLDALEKSVLYKYGQTLKDQRIKETTVVAALFGGYFRSQVRCDICKYESNTYDQYLDISLEVDRCTSLIGAFKHFTASERLDSQNLYKCKRCAPKRVPACKQLTIYRAPNVLCIHLKRFSMGNGLFGAGKINKHIQFDTKLNISAFMSNRNETHHNYSLCGVLVHSGYSANSGHYYSFVKAPNGIWHEMNDSSVHQVNESTVLSQHAYMLFYIRTDQIVSTTATPLSTPIKTNGTPIKTPNGTTVQHNNTNGTSNTTDVKPIHNVAVKRKIVPTAVPVTPVKPDTNGTTVHTNGIEKVDNNKPNVADIGTEQKRPDVAANLFDSEPTKRRLSINTDESSNDSTTQLTKSISTPIPVDSHIFTAPTPKQPTPRVNTPTDTIVNNDVGTAYESHIVSPRVPKHRSRSDTNNLKRSFSNSMSYIVSLIRGNKKPKFLNDSASDVTTDTGTESDQSTASKRSKRKKHQNSNTVPVTPINGHNNVIKGSLVNYNSSDSDESTVVKPIDSIAESDITQTIVSNGTIDSTTDKQSIRSAVHEQFNLTPKRTTASGATFKTQSQPSTPFYPRASNNQYGTKVDTWDNEHIDARRQQQNITVALQNDITLKLNGHAKDEYDKMYDAGRTRKVKNHDQSKLRDTKQQLQAVYDRRQK